MKRINDKNIEKFFEMIEERYGPLGVTERMVHPEDVKLDAIRFFYHEGYKKDDDFELYWNKLCHELVSKTEFYELVKNSWRVGVDFTRFTSSEERAFFTQCFLNTYSDYVTEQYHDSLNAINNVRVAIQEAI